LLQNVKGSVIFPNGNAENVHWPSAQNDKEAWQNDKEAWQNDKEARSWPRCVLRLGVVVKNKWLF